MQREAATIIAAVALTLMVRVIYMTFGVSMDAMFAGFTSVASSLVVSAGWHTVIDSTLGNWATFFTMEVLMYIIIWGWVLLTLVMDTGYNKPGYQ